MSSTAAIDPLVRHRDPGLEPGEAIQQRCDELLRLRLAMINEPS
jgi:hypothetical protein